jgi:hypothetical protein
VHHRTRRTKLCVSLSSYYYVSSATKLRVSLSSYYYISRSTLIDALRCVPILLHIRVLILLYTCAQKKKKRINAYSRVSDTLVELRVGGRFNMFAGKITGGFEDLAHGGHIKCKWRMAHWKPGQVAAVVSACWFSQCMLV